jgi:solute carrier family 25 phosphate transporter 3
MSPAKTVYATSSESADHAKPEEGSNLICRVFADMAGPERAKNFQTPIFLAASASAEVIADVALCPWEAVKV